MWDQYDWVDLPPFVEFSYNKIVYTTHKQMRFFAAYYQCHKNNFENPRDNIAKSKNPEGVNIVKDLDTIREARRQNKKAA